MVNKMASAAVSAGNTVTAKQALKAPAATPAAESRPAALPGDVRVISYNTAVGNSKVKTPQADFTRLPLYQAALNNAPNAPILALQEVGKKQIEAARAFEKRGTCTVIVQRVSARDQYNAIIIPKRYAVKSSESEHYLKAQIKAIGRATWKFIKSFGHERTRLVDLWQPRGYLKAEVKDSQTGRAFTVFDTHMALDDRVRLDQAKQLMADANAAARKGPVVLAGDLNTRNAATDKKGTGAAMRATFADWQDMGEATASETTLHSGAGNIDWVLAKGFTPVSSQVLKGQDLRAPDGKDAAVISDHFAEANVLRFTP